jgi:hypothetical protein
MGTQEVPFLGFWVSLFLTHNPIFCILTSSKSEFFSYGVG